MMDLLYSTEACIPGMVSNIKFKTTPFQIKMTWSAPVTLSKCSNQFTYVVIYSNRSLRKDVHLVEVGKTTNYVLNDLMPGSIFEFGVRAKSGCSQYGPPQFRRIATGMIVHKHVATVDREISKSVRKLSCFKFSRGLFSLSGSVEIIYGV